VPQEQSPAYGRDLAFIHDAGFGDFAHHAAQNMLSLLEQRGTTRGLIVDLGCGGGISARAYTRAGFDVLGIDISRSQIALARRHAPRARFRVRSLFDAKIPRCVGVSAIGECFNYLFDRSNDARALERVLRRVFAALEPGGVLMFDVSTPGRVADGLRRDFFEGRGWTVTVEASEDRRHRQLRRAITSYRRAGSAYRRSFELHELRLWSAREVVRLLKRIGFEVATRDRYGVLRLPEGMVCFVATKRRRA
jgi:SAM-dependent methyltransferase